MTIKPVRPRAIATADFDDITDFYVAEAGIAVAQRFGAALTAAFDRLEANPAIGSPLIGEACKRPGLRTWPVTGFPYLVCYFDGAESVDVWRILHGARDLALLLGEAGENGADADG